MSEHSSAALDDAPMLDLKGDTTLEACARAGLLPEELEWRSLASFAEEGLEAAVQEVRYEHFVRKRREKIRIVLEEHEKIIHEEAMRVRAQELVQRAGAAEEQDADVQNTVLLRKEQAQLERLKERQKQDIQQLLAYEMRMAQQHKENEAKMEREAAAKREKERLKRQRQAEDEARRAKKDQEKLEREREEEKQRRILIAKEAKAAKLQAELEQQQEIQRRRDARRREEVQAERQRRRMEATRKIFEAQQQELLQKKKNMDRKQRERQAALEAKRAALAHENELKRMEQTQRVQTAMQNQERILEEQREEYARKQKSAEARQEAFLNRREQERQEAQDRAAEKAALIERTRRQMEQHAEERRQKAEDLEKQTSQRLLRRKMDEEFQNRQKARESRERDDARRRAYQQMMNAQRAKCNAIFRKRQQKEAAVARRKAREKTTNAVQEELARLREQDRVELIERKRRMEEHKRKRIMDKIQREGERAAQIREQREKLIVMRKQQRIEADKQKKDIVKTFDLMRATGKLVLPKELRGMDLGLASTPSPTSLPQVHSSRTPTHRSKTALTTVPRESKRPASAAARSGPAAPRKAAASQNSSQRSEDSLLTAGRESDNLEADMSGIDEGDGAAPLTQQRNPRAPNNTDYPQGKGKSHSQQTSQAWRASKRSPSPLAKKKKTKRSAALKPPSNPRARIEEEIKALKRKQNMHLLSILEEEQANERRRESLVKKTKSEKERKRLDQRFGHERAKASERIMRITHDHEQVMSTKIAELNRALAQQSLTAH